MADNNEINSEQSVEETASAAFEETSAEAVQDTAEESVEEIQDDTPADSSLFWDYRSSNPVEEVQDDTPADGDDKDEASDDADKAADDADKASDDADKASDDSEKQRRKRMDRRRFKYGSIATAITVIVIAVAVVVNIILTLAADRINMTMDLTGKGTFEISQETKDYIATVKEPVHIVCLSEENEFKTSNYVYYKQAYEVLRKYTIYGDTITLDFVDMVKDPSYAERYSKSYKGELNQYNIVVESDKRIKVLSIKDLYNVEINYNTYQQEVVSSKAEQELTSAIMYVTDPDPMNVTLFNSATQSPSYDNVRSILEANGYEVSEIDPLSQTIPEDTDIVVINAPLNDYDEKVIDGLYSFLDNGGALGKNLVYIADSSQKETANIDAFLAEWGIKVGSGVVGENDAANRQTTRSYYIIRDKIQANDYSVNVAQPDLPVIDYQSRPIELLFETSDTRTTVPLLTTADTAFVFTQELQEAYENGDNVEIPNGTYNTWAVSKKYVWDANNQPVYSNVLVIGSGWTLCSDLTETTYFNNGDYFMSVMNTMTGKNSGISIIAKDLKDDSFDLDEATFNKYRVMYVMIIPLIAVIAGIAVFIRRRSK